MAWNGDRIKSKTMEKEDKVRTTDRYCKLQDDRFSGTIVAIEERTGNSPLVTVDVGCGELRSIDRNWLQYDNRKCCCCCCY